MPGEVGSERADLPQSRVFISFETYLFCCSFGNLINLLSDSWVAGECVHVEVCWLGDGGGWAILSLSALEMNLTCLGMLDRGSSFQKHKKACTLKTNAFEMYSDDFI